jgi:regulator of protease activity HflC (stomatin/prohibitin superfamily)
MSFMGFVILLVVAGPIVGFVAWLLLDESIVRIPSGNLGLLLVQGKATKKVLGPGRHIVPSFRQHAVQQYPTLELAYRADGGADAVHTVLERSGPVIEAVLGDRTPVVVACTIRYRLVADRLRDVHESVGPDGVWSSIRDLVEHELRDALLEPTVTTDSLYGRERRELGSTLSLRLRTALEAHGFTLTGFSLAGVDLGAAGTVVAATARARLELEREKAEARVRKQRVTNDAQLADAWGERTADIALRHRELDTWRELLGREGSIAPQPGAAHVRRPPSPQQDPDTTPSADRLPTEPALGADDGSAAGEVDRT